MNREQLTMKNEGRGKGEYISQRHGATFGCLHGEHGE